MKLFHILVFMLIYLREVVLSTWRIAVMVLRPRLDLKPQFVEVPLDLQGEMPRFLLACLISMTPGSLSVGVNPERGLMMVHLLDAPDPEAAIREIKDVLEQPLIRIFGRC
jgi:multisubunit Na+/H+ antiporter MnhE subunit